jgi:uncharacterized lipoprotein YmbA
VTRRSIPLALLAVLAACATSPTPRYYTLGAGAGNTAPVQIATDALSIWVAPVTLPESVDRPQMVVRVAPNRVAILDGHRWAEPLSGAMSRAIAADLAALLGGARVSAEAQHAASGAQFRVLVDVQRFESVPGQGVTLEALWLVRRQGETDGPRGHALVTEAVRGAPADPAGAPDYDALAAAHSRALAALSRDIAQALRQAKR